MNLLERACKASLAPDLDTAENLTKEAMQEMILYLLDRNGFFDKAVFHGDIPADSLRLVQVL